MKSYNYDLAPGPPANTTAATGGTTSPASSTGELPEPAVMEPAPHVPLPTEPTADTTAATGGTTSASSTGHEPAVMDPALDVPLPAGPAARVFVLI